MVNKITDTTDLLTAEDQLLLDKIEYIKQNITNYISPDEMIDKIREVIDGSDIITFKNKRNSKYISKVRPLFIVSVDKKKSAEKYNHQFVYKEGTEPDMDVNPEIIADYNFIYSVIQKEITSVYSNFLTNKLTNSEEFMKILNDNNIDLDEDEFSKLTIFHFLTASIFGITVELKANTIYIEYIIS